MNVVPEETRANGLRLPIKGEVSFKDVRFRYATYPLGEMTTFPVHPMPWMKCHSGCLPAQCWASWDAATRANHGDAVAAAPQCQL
jgi:hypothetical protein